MTPSASRRVRATATCSTRPGWPSRGPPATRSPTRRRRARAAARVEGRERSMANPIQLNRGNLKSIAGRAQVPSFDPAGLPGSIVHVGVGGFHRAHQAVYLDDLLAQGGARQWGLCGGGLRPHDARTRHVPRPQDWRSPVAARGGAGDRDIARRMYLAFAERREEKLAKWIAENGAFPNGMVDRITPATTDAHRDLVRESFGIIDGWPVVTEPFKQWVIEDRFPAGRPPWERVGAQMVSDVHPYEMMKIRLLNASHQALCYIGMLLGYRYADETMEDSDIRALVERMMSDEVTPLLPPVPGIDLAQYRRTLIERFGNPVLRDQLARIGTEGSARIPKFVLPSILDRVSRGGPMRALTFTEAAWFRYLDGTD